MIATCPYSIVSFGKDESGEVYIVGFEGPVYLLEPLPGELSTAVLAHESELPQVHALHQNYPNPFNSGTVIRFSRPTSQHIELAIYNLAGQKVVTLVDGTRQAGTYTVRWDGRDVSGRGLASGVYLYRLKAGVQAQTRKLLLLR